MRKPPTDAGRDETVKARIRAGGERALAEATARRQRAAGRDDAAKEIGGRDGPDPVRYGDWEVKGTASDF